MTQSLRRVCTPSLICCAIKSLLCWQREWDFYDFFKNNRPCRLRSLLIVEPFSKTDFMGHVTKLTYTVTVYKGRKSPKLSIWKSLIFYFCIGFRVRPLKSRTFFICFQCNTYIYIFVYVHRECFRAVATLNKYRKLKISLHLVLDIENILYIIDARRMISSHWNAQFYLLDSFTITSLSIYLRFALSPLKFRIFMDCRLW